MKKINQLAAGAAVLALGCFFAGCQSADGPRGNRPDDTVKHFEGAKYSQVIEGKKLTLRECMENAQRNTLNAKVATQEQTIARELSSAETFSKLPSFDSNKLTDTDLSLEILDLALSMLNEKQAKDRVYLAEQRKLRASQQLTLEVIRAYYSIAAAQKVIALGEVLLKARAKAGKSDAASLQSFKALEKKVQQYKDEKDRFCLELCNLMGYVPSNKIVVDDSCMNGNSPALKALNSIKFPAIELLEQIALLKRVELYEIGIERRVNLYDVRNEIKALQPQVAPFFNFSADHIYYLSWYNFGLRAAYSLMADALDINSNWNAAEKRGIAQALAIAGQVRIAHADFVTRMKLYQIDSQATGIREFDRLFALRNSYISFFRLLNALGIKSVISGKPLPITEEIVSASRLAEKELVTARKTTGDRAAAGKAAQSKAAVQALTNFGTVDFFKIYDSTPAKAAQAGKGGK